jgi:hypothetical protein
MIEKIRTVSPDPILERSPINEATVAKVAHVNHVIEEVNKELANLPSVRPKVYKALLTQSGTDAPVATVLENTLGKVVWGYDSVGAYTATLDDAFVDNKTVLLISSGINNVSALNDSLDIINVGRNDIDSIYVSTGIADATGARDVANDVLYQHTLFVEVYP